MDDSAWLHALAAHRVHRDITRALGRRFGDDAEDCVAEALLRVCTASTRDEEHAKRLTARTATGLAIDARRHRGVARKNAPRLAEPTTSESAEDTYMDVDLRLRVAYAVDALPPLQRDVIRHYAEGRPAKEIAEQVGRSPYSVKHVIARTLHQLREQLRDAELALIAWRLRRRRRGLDVAASPSLAVSVPALAVVVTLSLPVFVQISALVLRSFHTRTVVTGRGFSRGDAFDMAASTMLRTLSAHGVVSSPPVNNAVDDTVNRAVAPLPPEMHVRVTDDGRGVWVDNTRKGPTVERQPDYDDPIGDAVYCAENLEISPTYIGCRPRP